MDHHALGRPLAVPARQLLEGTRHPPVDIQQRQVADHLVGLPQAAAQLGHHRQRRPRVSPPGVVRRPGARAPGAARRSSRLRWPSAAGCRAATSRRRSPPGWKTERIISRPDSPNSTTLTLPSATTKSDSPRSSALTTTEFFGKSRTRLRRSRLGERRIAQLPEDRDPPEQLDVLHSLLPPAVQLQSWLVLKSSAWAPPPARRLAPAPASRRAPTGRPRPGPRGGWLRNPQGCRPPEPRCAAGPRTPRDRPPSSAMDAQRLGPGALGRLQARPSLVDAPGRFHGDQPGLPGLLTGSRDRETLAGGPPHRTRWAAERFDHRRDPGRGGHGSRGPGL